MDKVIEASDLAFAYNSAFVLKEVSFSVAQGEFIGIFGPNGGGKTTLLHLLMGFLKPTHGKISIFGKSPKEARPRMAWVPQIFNFDRNFPISVKEVVLAGRLFHTHWHGYFQKEDIQIMEEALEQVGMKAYLNVPYSSLSGGQAQRVLIARALASQPDLLLLDEPTASIDFATQNAVYKMLRELKGKMTILMVTHDLKNALDLADRLFCVQGHLTPMSRAKVCEHYALGLYHPPEVSA